MNMTPMPFFPRIATSALALAAALAGCASAPVHYTLSAPAGTASAPAGAQAAYMIDVLPVSVPTPADQPQLMVRNGDGSVSALYSERWTAPLADEVRGALSDALQRELGALDVRVVKPASSAAVWRVQTDVQRFDLSPGAAHGRHLARPSRQPEGQRADLPHGGRRAGIGAGRLGAGRRAAARLVRWRA